MDSKAFCGVKGKKLEIEAGNQDTHISHQDNDVPGIIAAAKTEFELFKVFDQLGTAFELPYFIIFQIAGEEDKEFASLALVSNWPAFLIAEYDENKLLEKSPIMARLRTSTEPLVWTLDAINKGREDGKENVVTSMFRRHGMEMGVYLSVHLPDGRIGGVGFCGDRVELHQTELVELHYLANLLYSKIHALRDVSKHTDFGLNARELDCLRWTSQGKTSGEIATILDLSEHTVNHYLSDCARKLDCTNRTHAVSKAIRMNIIR